MIIFCPQCQKRIIVQDLSSGYSHDCGDFPISATLGNEDVVNVHTSFADFDGTITQGPAEATMFKGIVGRNWMSRGDIENNPQVHNLTTRGNPKDWYRTRRRFTYIENP